MKEYKPGDIRNFAIVGHASCGKTMLSEAMLACGGQSWHHLEFEYPADQKLAFDEFVTRASYALNEYNQTGCPETER